MGWQGGGGVAGGWYSPVKTTPETKPVAIYHLFIITSPPLSLSRRYYAGNFSRRG
jgi:hypothetical protein